MSGLNKSTELSIASCGWTVVYVFSDSDQTWQEPGAGSWSELHIFHVQDDEGESYRIQAWTHETQEVLVNVKFDYCCEYTESDNFHSFKDGNLVRRRFGFYKSNRNLQSARNFLEVVRGLITEQKRNHISTLRIVLSPPGTPNGPFTQVVLFEGKSELDPKETDPGPITVIDPLGSIYDEKENMVCEDIIDETQFEFSPILYKGKLGRSCVTNKDAQPAQNPTPSMVQSVPALPHDESLFPTVSQHLQPPTVCGVPNTVPAPCYSAKNDIPSVATLPFNQPSVFIPSVDPGIFVYVTAGPPHQVHVAPPQQGYAPAPQQGYAPTPQQGYAPTPQQGFAPPQQGYAPSPREFQPIANYNQQECYQQPYQPLQATFGQINQPVQPHQMQSQMLPMSCYPCENLITPPGVLLGNIMSPPGVLLGNIMSPMPTISPELQCYVSYTPDGSVLIVQAYSSLSSDGWHTAYYPRQQVGSVSHQFQTSIRGSSNFDDCQPALAPPVCCNFNKVEQEQPHCNQPALPVLDLSVCWNSSEVEQEQSHVGQKAGGAIPHPVRYNFEEPPKMEKKHLVPEIIRDLSTLWSGRLTNLKEDRSDASFRSPKCFQTRFKNMDQLLGCTKFMRALFNESNNGGRFRIQQVGFATSERTQRNGVINQVGIIVQFVLQNEKPERQSKQEIDEGFLANDIELDRPTIHLIWEFARHQIDFKPYFKQLSDNSYEEEGVLSLWGWNSETKRWRKF